MKNILIILTICTLISCKESSKKGTTQKKSFSLKGKINGNYSNYIYLNYGNVKDSVRVINNNFEFNGIVERPIQGWLNLKPDANNAWIYIENNNILVQADYSKKTQHKKTLNFLKVNSIKGSYSAQIQNEYKEFYQANQNKENFNFLLYEKLKVFIEKNKNHPFSGTILGEIALINPVLKKAELLKLFAKIDTTQQNTGDLKMFKMGIANLNEYGINKPFLKFTLPDTKDRNIDITTFLGKVTLIDFWASWCAPCRIKHPDLIKLKSKFKNDNFDIVSVSIDSNKKNWLEAIEKDKLAWTNLIDIDKKINNELGIQAIPFNYLIDENGIVLGVNLSTKEIEKIINKKTNR